MVGGRRNLRGLLANPINQTDRDKPAFASRDDVFDRFCRRSFNSVFDRPRIRHRLDGGVDLLRRFGDGPVHHMGAGALEKIDRMTMTESDTLMKAPKSPTEGSGVRARNDGV